MNEKTVWGIYDTAKRGGSSRYIEVYFDSRERAEAELRSLLKYHRGTPWEHRLVVRAATIKNPVQKKEDHADPQDQ